MELIDKCQILILIINMNFHLINLEKVLSEKFGRQPLRNLNTCGLFTYHNNSKFQKVIFNTFYLVYFRKLSSRILLKCATTNMTQSTKKEFDIFVH